MVSVAAEVVSTLPADPTLHVPDTTLGAGLELVEEPTVDDPPVQQPTVDQLERLQKHVQDGGTLDLPLVASDDWQGLLAQLLRIGAPKPNPEGELDSVQRVIDHRERWHGLPRRIQCLVIEWLTARLRALQVRGVRDWRVDQGFTVLTHYSRTEQPGFSYGLARSHGPRNDSWDDDAEVHAEELRRLLPTETIEPPNKDKLLSRVQELRRSRRLQPTGPSLRHGAGRGREPPGHATGEPGQRLAGPPGGGPLQEPAPRGPG